MTGLPQVLPLTRAIARPLQGSSLGPAPLVMDFRNPASVDGQYTFTRASGGGRFNASGVYEFLGNDVPRLDYDPVTLAPRGLLIEEQRTNLLTASEQVDLLTYDHNAVTIIRNAVVGKSGKVDASLLVPTSTSAQHFVFRRQQYNYAAGTTYCGSIYAKDGGNRYLQLTFPGSAFGTDQYANFDLQLGVVSASVGVTAAISHAGDGWYRCSIAVAATATNTTAVGANLVLITSGTSARAPSFAGITTNGIYIWGPQLEAGAFPTSYIPTPATFTSRASTATYFNSSGVLTTAAANEARYDHRFIGGQWVPTGLFLEAAATNLLTYSEQFDNAAWTKASSAIVANSAIAPDGTASADKLVEDLTIENHSMYRVVNYTAAAHSFSVRAKNAGRNFIWVRANHSGSSFSGAFFNLTTGEITGAINCTPFVTQLAGGWFECKIVYTPTTTAAGYVYIYARETPTNSTYQGDGTSGIYIWGAQLEVGSQPTSYIPTVASQVTRAADVSSSAQVTRSADVASVNTLSPWHNATEGTIVVEANIPNPASGMNHHIFGLSDGTFNNFVAIRKSPSNLQFVVTTSGVTVVNILRSLPTGIFKAALSLQSNNTAAAFGGTVSIDSSNTIPPASVLRIGSLAAAGQYANGHLQSIEYYPRRLSNTELQEITA